MKNLLKTKKSAMILTVISLLTLFALPSLASAGGLAGGLSSAKSNLDTLKTWAYTAAGTAAVLYLLFKAVQAWQGRCEWGEFLMAIVYVALAGGSVTLAAWAFGVFA